MKKDIGYKNDLPQEAYNAKIKTEIIQRDMYAACKSLNRASLTLKATADNINKMILSTK